MIRALAVASLVLLAACAGKKEELLCPRLSIVGEASTATVFVGAGRDPIDVLSTTQITGIEGGCTFTDKDRTVLTQVQIGLSLTRGPAARDEIQAQVDYFVAVVTADGQILGKQVFQAPVEFRRGARTYVMREEIEQRIPLGDRRPGEVAVVTGLQLTPDQREWNRRQVEGRTR